MDARRRRIAENEVRFRDINERLRRGLEAVVDAVDHIDFVCECGYAECVRTIPMTVGDYEHVRSDGRWFAALTGHEIPDTEDVVERHEGYVILQKKPPSAPLVEGRDPRG